MPDCFRDIGRLYSDFQPRLPLSKIHTVVPQLEKN